MPAKEDVGSETSEWERERRSVAAEPGAAEED